jgi:prolipoprotein diacylglyceryl transferase
MIKHPVDIFKVWEGGLASHGGAIGVMVALWLYLRTVRKTYPQLTYVTLLDLMVIPTALVGCFIRLGNFFNQEIIGTGTTLPWGVIFGNPMDGGTIIPRHPAQLYEALAYLLTFVFLYTLWKVKGTQLKTGTLAGLFFILVFVSRFLIEFVKAPMDAVVDQSFLQMGQYLSLPFIALGFYLLLKKEKLEIKTVV